MLSRSPGTRLWLCAGALAIAAGMLSISLVAVEVQFIKNFFAASGSTVTDAELPRSETGGVLPAVGCGPQRSSDLRADSHKLNRVENSGSEALGSLRADSDVFRRAMVLDRLISKENGALCPKVSSYRRLSAGQNDGNGGGSNGNNGGGVRAPVASSETAEATLLDPLGSMWEGRGRLAPPDAREKAAGERRYFIAALLSENVVGSVFGAFQRELVKTVDALGNHDLSNIFVSVYSNASEGSSDVVQLPILGLESLLKALRVPHRVALGYEEREESAAQRNNEPLLAGLRKSYSEEAARARNEALRPLLEGEGANGGGGSGEYDAVLFLDGMLFCAADAVNLLRAVSGGTESGKNADLSCGLSFALRDGQPVVRDSWAVQGAYGTTLSGEPRPLPCGMSMTSNNATGPAIPPGAVSTANSSSTSSLSVPLPVFSCWGGMAAADADLFTSLGLRFRSPRRLECQQTAPELFVRDMRALGRNGVVLLPSARVALDWAAFSSIYSGNSSTISQNKDKSRSKEEGKSGAFSSDGLLRMEALAPALTAAAPPPRVLCCGLGRLGDTASEALIAQEAAELTGPQTCIVEPDWRFVYSAYGVPTANKNRTGSEGFASSSDRKQQLLLRPAAEEATAASLQQEPARTSQAHETSAAADKTAANKAAADKAAAGKAAAEMALPPPSPSLPNDFKQRLVQWSSNPLVYGDKFDTLAALASASYAAANPQYDIVSISDAELLTWASASGAGAEIAAPWLHGLETTLPQSPILHGSFLRLVYAFENGGVFVPPLSLAGRPFEELLRSEDQLVVGISAADPAASDLDLQRLLFLATAPRVSAMEAVLREARERLLSPRATYQRMWDSINATDCHASGCSPEAMEESRFTGMQLFSDVVPSLSASLGARLAVFHAEDARYGIGVPQRLCADLRARAQRKKVGVAELVGYEASPVRLLQQLQGKTLWTLASGVLRSPEFRHTVGDSATKTTLFSLPVHKRMLPGQYIFATPRDLNAPEPIASESVKPPNGAPAAVAAATAAAAGSGSDSEICSCGPPAEKGRRCCFLWLAPNGSFGLFNGYGPIDPDLRAVSVLQEAAAAPAPVPAKSAVGTAGEKTAGAAKLVFGTEAEEAAEAAVEVTALRWLMLQNDGNLVLLEGTVRARVRPPHSSSGESADSVVSVARLWGTGTESWSFPSWCAAGSICHDGAYVALHDDGVLTLQRGVSQAMRAYLEVGVAAVSKLRSCLFRTERPPRPKPDSELEGEVVRRDESVRGLAEEEGPEKQQVLEEQVEKCVLPQILKLATFPNSGTSFTLQAAMAATGAASFTKYVRERQRTLETLNINASSPLEACNRHACMNLGACALRGLQTRPPPGHGALFKTHAAQYYTGYYNPDLSCFAQGLSEGYHRVPVNSYGFLRLFRNPFDNMVAQLNLLCARAQPGAARPLESLKNMTNDRAGFLSHNAILPKRNIYTYMYWHLSFNLAAKQSGLPTALLTYEDIYLNPVGYLRQLTDMLGYSEEEVPTPRLMELAKRALGRDIAYHRGEPLPVYIDSFYSAALVREIASVIEEVLKATDCLSQPIYPRPRYGLIPFLDQKKQREMPWTQENASSSAYSS